MSKAKNKEENLVYFLKIYKYKTLVPEYTRYHILLVYILLFLLFPVLFLGPGATFLQPNLDLNLIISGSTYHLIINLSQ